MKQAWIGLLLGSFLILSWGCSDQGTLSPSVQAPDGQSNMAITFSLSGASGDVAHVIVSLARSGYDTLKTELAIVGDSAKGIIQSIPAGKWTLAVDVVSTTGVLLYRGASDVLIQSGVTTYVNIVLNPIGSLSVSVSWGTGTTKAGTALSLNGTTAYVEVPPSVSLNAIDSSVTMEAWIKPKNQYYNTVVCKGSAAYAIEPTVMYVGALFVGVHFTMPEDMNYWGHILTPYVLTSDTWTHVAVVFAGGSGAVKFYVNGELKTQYPCQGLMTPEVSPLRIGARADPNYTEYYGGIIDEVRIWKLVRTQAEIQSTMRTTLTGSEKGLVGYWNFNDVSPDGVVKDKSPYHNDGALRGGAGTVTSDCF